jgi:hypothetical protein
MTILLPQSDGTVARSACRRAAAGASRRAAAADARRIADRQSLRALYRLALPRR